MFPEEDSNLVLGHLQNLCVGHEKNPVVLSMLSDGNLWQMRASTCDDKPLATVDKKQVSTDNWQLEICFNEQCKKCKGKKSQGSSTSLESKLEMELCHLTSCLCWESPRNSLFSHHTQFIAGQTQGSRSNMQPCVALER